MGIEATHGTLSLHKRYNIFITDNSAEKIQFAAAMPDERAAWYPSIGAVYTQVGNQLCTFSGPYVKHTGFLQLSRTPAALLLRRSIITQCAGIWDLRRW